MKFVSFVLCELSGKVVEILERKCMAFSVLNAVKKQ